MLMLVILVSCLSSYLVNKYFYKFTTFDTNLKNSTCRYCDVEGKAGDGGNVDRMIDCCVTENTHSLPVSRVKSGKLGHQVNSDTHLQTVEIQMRRLMSRLIRIFTVCLVNLFFIPITEL